MIIMHCMVQVATENELIGRSEAFEQAMNENALAQFCDYKVANSDGEDQETWLYLRIFFEADPKRHVSCLQPMSCRLAKLAKFTLTRCCPRFGTAHKRVKHLHACHRLPTNSCCREHLYFLWQPFPLT